MDTAEARHIAEAQLAQWNAAQTPNRLENPHATSPDPDDQLVVTEVEAHSRAWVVRFATRRWVRTKSAADVVGISPIVIDRATGELHLYGSAPAEHAKFRSWLDDPRPD